jgi:PKD repeat protein
MPYLPTTTLANNNVNQEGTYIVLVTDVNDCQHYSNKLTVLKRPLPKYTVSLSQSIVCLGTTSSAIINASVTPHTISSPYSYLWSVSSPLTVLSPIAPTTNVNIPLGTPVGTYFLYLTVKNDSTGCIKLDTFCIDVRSAPSVNITPTSTICAGNPTLLIPSPNNTTMYDYVWNNGPTSPTQLVSLFGIYELTIIDKATGCSAVSNQVVVNPVPDLHLFPIGCDSLCSFDHLYIPLANNSNPTGPSFLYPTKKWYVNGVLVGNMDFLPLAAYVNTSIVVHVEVSNNYGCSSTSADYHIFVKNCDSCTASAMFTHSIMGFTSTFTNTSTSNGTATYYWTFGDGASSSATSPSHTYAAHGIYTVCLHEYNVTSSDTCVDSLCMNICICSDTFCCDSFLNYLRFKTITTNFVTVSSVQFIPPLLLPTDIVQWDFDCNGIIDNVTTGNTAVTFAYPSTGHYTVCATVLRLQGGDTCWATLTKSITITGKQCSCDTSFTSNVAAGFAVSSVGTTVTYVPLALTNCDTISWNFDDGTAIVHSVGNASVVHTYSAVNSYYVCMTVQRAGSPNCVKTYCRKVLVKPCVCDTSFAGNVASGFATSMAGTTVTFVPIALTNCDTITWDFGDGTGAFTSVGNASIVHVFTSLNAYYVCMRVVRAGSLNCVNTFCKKVTVTSIQKVVLNNLKIYPNPANDFITIDASAVPENTIAQISFFDITGRKLFTEEWKEEASQSINVSSYTSGVYILSIETKEGRLLNNFRIEKY